MTKAEETRLRILNVAFEHASEYGLESLTIGGLANLVGMSKSGLFSHFKSKDNLQISVLEYAGQIFSQRVVQPARCQTHNSVEEKLRVLLQHWLEWNQSLQGSCMFLNCWRELHPHTDDVQVALEGLTRHWLEYLYRQFKRGVEQGEFSSDLDCWQAVYRIYGIYLSSQFFASMAMEGGNRERFWAEVDVAFSSWLKSK
ncbi:TetR/AcrR family transcriptional regulator [Thaumasiovibrio sp. DFM-14]|uniref:TetR/AcrR family transcriptional regulator n=1 Tax=Thaumasiovibrio sp. DFM-14 TaxID=3384792 RepID=UPI00399F8A9B